MYWISVTIDSSCFSLSHSTIFLSLSLAPLFLSLSLCLPFCLCVCVFMRLRMEWGGYQLDFVRILIHVYLALRHAKQGKSIHDR